MGKVRRQRQKFHISKNLQLQEKADCSSVDDTAPLLPLTPPKENLFAGITIDFENIKKNVSDDIRSVKSFKSIKSEAGKNIVSKKEKVKLRRELLLKKIDTVQQMKKELKIRKKRKNTSLIGDTNPLHDALPSLESLLKSRSNIKYNMPMPNIKKKSIDKASRRKKGLIQGVNAFKQTLKNKHFKKNPFEAISNHIKAVVEQEKSLSKK